jgi:hypothetical protein
MRNAVFAQLARGLFKRPYIGQCYRHDIRRSGFAAQRDHRINGVTGLDGDLWERQIASNENVNIGFKRGSGLLRRCMLPENAGWNLGHVIHPWTTVSRGFAQLSSSLALLYAGVHWAASIGPRIWHVKIDSLQT